MTVHFIGAGPGAPDLITVRGRDLIARCPVCLYAGSLVPREILAHCPPGARIVDTAPLTLDEIVAEFVAAHARARTSRGSIPATSRSGARWASSSAGSSGAAFPTPHARRARLRRGRRGARARADAAGGGAIAWC